MTIIETDLKDVFLLKPRIFEDDRGYFFESFSIRVLEEAGLDYQFVQDNESKSSYGVIRGLHYQLAPFAQAKLVRVIAGKILDVVVDLRQNSETYGKWQAFELNAQSKYQLLIPRGFAHGFSVLSEQAIFQYKCDNYYRPDAERGIAFNDPMLNIDWQVDPDKAIVSAKDKVLPSFAEADKNFF